MDFNELRKKREGQSTYLKKYNEVVTPLVEKLEMNLERINKEDRNCEQIKRNKEEERIEDIKRKLDSTLLTSEIENIVEVLGKDILEVGKSNKKLKIINEELDSEIEKLNKREEAILEKEVKKLKKKIKNENELEGIIELLYSESFRDINMR